MSKSKDTKERIFSHALKLFNARGIEVVGLREIAKDLNLRVGNITYYYPTKGDLVEAVANALAEQNSKTLVHVQGISVKTILEQYKIAFENHYMFRCLFINFVYLLELHKKIEKEYLKIQQIRFDTMRANMAELKKNRYLNKNVAPEQLEYLVSCFAFTGRFWLAESRVRFKGESKQKIFQHYLCLLADHLLPFCSAKGKKEVFLFKAEVLK